MVVDDDQDVRFVVTSLLSLEFETVGAQNGLDALEKIDRYEPDLLLMDVSMPVMNGIACCQAIQRSPQFEKLPVMFLAAASEPAIKRQAISVGGKAYIEKPFETSMLIQQIKDCFASQGTIPSSKVYTIEQIATIDATPLEALGGMPIDPAAPSAETTSHLLTFPGETGKDRKRRLFGKGAQKQQPPHDKEGIAPEGEPPPVELPPPPPPDYKAVAERYSKDRVRRDQILPETPARKHAPEVPPAPPQQERPAARRQEPAIPPPRQPEPQKPPASHPPPTAPTKRTPAEILSERRLAALQSSTAPATQPRVKPRLLTIIDHPDQLAACHASSKGIAEFLPLEDPVEALVLIARFQPDIVMLGVHEARYSGIQIANMLRVNPRLSHIETIFVEGAWTDPAQLTAARKLSRNPILRMPIRVEAVQSVLKEIIARPTFQVRGKNLSYGVYVKEVIRAAESERAKENKIREKESLQAHVTSLAKFMAEELKDYREAPGYEELKGIGRNVHVVRDWDA